MATPFDLGRRLAEREAQSLYRRRRVLESAQATSVHVDGKSMLNFCSNDYLGLAADSRVVAALRQGAADWGAGGGASHLVIGHSVAHHRLEEELADFVGCERALLFSSGWLANLAVITALTGRGDVVLQDRLNHASLIDGGLLSGARFHRYRHCDVEHLERLLSAGKDGHALVVTDGVFSMDGDVAPLPGLSARAEGHHAWLMVDDAHGVGVLGPQGRGSLASFGLQGCRTHILMGTLGKAFGTQGAFVAGSAELVEALIQFARPYIYTTSLSPALAVATSASLAIVREESWRRDRLQALINRFRAGAAVLGLSLMPSETPIQPLLAGSAEDALAWSAALAEQGILVSAIRPPTVPQGTARLRVTFSAMHELQEVDRLLDALARTRPTAVVGSL